MDTSTVSVTKSPKDHESTMAEQTVRPFRGDTLMFLEAGSSQLIRSY